MAAQSAAFSRPGDLQQWSDCGRKRQSRTVAVAEYGPSAIWLGGKGAGLACLYSNVWRTVCDYAETPTSVFANARNQADALGTGLCHASIVSVSQTSGRALPSLSNGRSIDR